MLYDGGHCLPKDVKVEPEEIKSNQMESFANRSASAEEVRSVWL